MAQLPYTKATPGAINNRFSHKESVEAELGDLLLYDSVSGKALPASQMADQSTEAATQAYFAARFMGISESVQLASDTTARPAKITIDTIVTDFPCDSATFEPGDYVAPKYTAGVLSNQVLVKTTNPSCAIGRATKRYGSATTEVEVRITSRLLDGLLVTTVGEGGDITALSITADDAALNITGKVGSSSVGGTVPITGGAGNGAFAGGAVSLTGGASGSGATGNGGAASVAGGAALSTAGSGGAVSLTGGVATTTGTGGAVTILGGASAGASGTAGSVTIDPGAAAGGTAGSVTICGTNGTLKVGSSTGDQAGIKGVYLSSVVAVAVPTIADAEADQVDVDVSAAFTMQPAVGDMVIAIPQESLMTDALLNGAFVSATDHVIISFGTKEGGAGVTGANKNFKFLVIDLT